jgi:menaquinone-dependent protoporphyrinogen oxidase
VNVLVAFASKYGATEEIARAIAEALEQQTITAACLAAKDVAVIAGYDAFVIGSGVYVGKWLADARKLVEREANALASMPVWLFSSGPIGDPPVPKGGAVDATALIAATGARDHRVFPGRLDKARLSFADRIVVGAVRAPEGDFRDWDEIRSWASEIAKALTNNAAHGG